MLINKSSNRKMLISPWLRLGTWCNWSTWNSSFLRKKEDGCVYLYGAIMRKASKLLKQITHTTTTPLIFQIVLGESFAASRGRCSLKLVSNQLKVLGQILISLKWLDAGEPGSNLQNLCLQCKTSFLWRMKCSDASCHTRALCVYHFVFLKCLSLWYIMDRREIAENKRQCCVLDQPSYCLLTWEGLMSC